MRPILALLLSFFLLPSFAAIAPAESARPSSASLREKHGEIADRLAKSPFGKPLHLEAGEDRDRVSGAAYAVLDHGFARASAALSDPAQWCEILLLPFNTKHCEASKGDSQGLSLTVHVGRKSSTALEDTHRLNFRFGTSARTPDYMRVELSAPAGPFGTREYLIVLEMAPLDERRTFLHFDYSYAYGSVARAAMKVYLATIASNKVGFTRDNEGLVRGMRAVMERNTMRYLLAIEAYLRAQGVAAGERPKKMVEDWFAAVERYPKQLHEMSREEYVPMKLSEYERMHASSNRAPRTASSSPSPS